MPACLFALNLSVLRPCWRERKRNCKRTSCVCARACVLSEGVGMASHPSGGTTTGPICQPKQRDWSEQLWHRLAQTQLTSPLHLPLISLFPLSAILLCIHPVITLLCYLYPPPSAVRPHPRFSFPSSSFFESSDLSGSPERPLLLSLQTDEPVDRKSVV